METEIIENHDLIAIRVPPGDNWRITNSQGETQGATYTSLTDTLEAWFQKTGEAVHFRLEPLNSKLYAIRANEVEIKPEPVKTFSLYGEYSQNNEVNN
jgi:hypothetical protein